MPEKFNLEISLFDLDQIAHQKKWEKEQKETVEFWFEQLEKLLENETYQTIFEKYENASGQEQEKLAGRIKKIIDFVKKIVNVLENNKFPEDNWEMKTGELTDNDIVGFYENIGERGGEVPIVDIKFTANGSVGIIQSEHETLSENSSIRIIDFESADFEYKDIYESESSINTISVDANSNMLCITERDGLIFIDISELQDGYMDDYEPKNIKNIDFSDYKDITEFFEAVLSPDAEKVFVVYKKTQKKAKGVDFDMEVFDVNDLINRGKAKASLSTFFDDRPISNLIIDSEGEKIMRKTFEPPNDVILANNIAPNNFSEIFSFKSNDLKGYDFIRGTDRVAICQGKQKMIGENQFTFAVIEMSALRENSDNPETVFKMQEPVLGFAIHKHVCALRMENEIMFIDLNQPEKPLASFKSESLEFEKIKFTPDGKKLMLIKEAEMNILDLEA